MMKALILICTLGLPRGDCSIDTAAAVVQGAEASHLAQCGFHGQVYPASTALADYLDGSNYLKILCTDSGPNEAKAALSKSITRVADAVPNAGGHQRVGIGTSPR